LRINVRLPIKTPKRIFRINKRFTTKSAITRRTVEVSEAFGIGVDDEKVFTVFEDFTVDINPGDVVYVTGDSGSGKSVLLHELAAAIANIPEFGGIAPVVDPPPEEIVIEGVGSHTGEAIEILSLCGLNEAFLMLRRYGELSDGQKYRYKLAKAIYSRAGTWVFDEFCATLDRVTAKVVSYTIQKAARRLGRTLIVATTHSDLIEDLNPDLLIEKRFGRSVTARRLPFRARSFSLMDNVKIRRAKLEEFRRLEEFHYRGGSRGPITHVFIAELDGEVIGGIVYSRVHVALRGRHLALPEYKILPMRRRMQRLNRDFLRISRVVVLPKFRGIGLGVRLVKETLLQVNVPYVETLAVMSRYNLFFEKAGFIRVYDPADDSSYLSELLNRLQSLGMVTDLIRSRRANLEMIRRLSPENLQQVFKLTIRLCKAKHLSRSFGLVSRLEKGDKEALAEALTRIPLPSLYLIWKNPNFMGYPDPRVPCETVNVGPVPTIVSSQVALER